MSTSSFKIHIGMDVHKDTVMVAVLPESTEKPTIVKLLPNDERGLRRFLPNPGKARRSDDETGARERAAGKKGVRERPEEAHEAIGRVHSETGRSYPMTMISEVWRVPRSMIYAARDRARRTMPPEPCKWGPKTAMSDEDLVVEIREVLRTSEFLGEGHRKVRARLRSKGIRVGKNRVLRLMQ